ncbi:MFS transporter [Krasilnikovia sp. MM14-A1004]|uniref:MFS transporter n=1 Tax=Krasilnikovia sp. MM14-A1004 TaxID=3373541 RepID=UPI00399C6AFF
MSVRIRRWRESGTPRPWLILAVATIGLGLDYLAWTLLGPLGLRVSGLGDPDTLGSPAWFGALLVAIGLLAGVPAGVWADRAGAGRVVAALSAGSAVAVLGLAAVHTMSEWVAVGILTAVGGTTFGAGGAAVLQAYAARGRGLALGVYGAGTALASAVAVITRPVFAIDGDESLLGLAILLGCYAVLAWVVLPDRPDPAARRLQSRTEIGALLRTPAITHLSAWYAVSFGGTVALDLYLPQYLHRGYGLTMGTASVCAGVCFGLTALSCPLGSWWCRRRQPVTLLVACHAAIAVVLFTLAFPPPSIAVPMLLLGILAASLGGIGGAALSVLGGSVPVGRAAATLGLVCAAAGLLGLLPPLLLASTDYLDGSYAIALTLLAVAALAAAVRLHRRRRWISAAATFPAIAVPESGTATTVVAVSARDIGPHLTEVVRALSSLAGTDELTIAYATTAGNDGSDLVAALREQLPGHSVLAVVTATPPHPHEQDLIADLLNSGAVPVAVLPDTDPASSALALAAHLDADRVLSVTAQQTLRLGTPLRSLADGDTPMPSTA